MRQQLLSPRTLRYFSWARIEDVHGCQAIGRRNAAVGCIHTNTDSTHTRIKEEKRMHVRCALW